MVEIVNKILNILLIDNELLYASIAYVIFQSIKTKAL